MSTPQEDLEAIFSMPDLWDGVTQFVTTNWESDNTTNVSIEELGESSTLGVEFVWGTEAMPGMVEIRPMLRSGDELVVRIPIEVMDDLVAEYLKLRKEEQDAS